jgi:sec-independent protein translocase protein TatB
VKDAASKFEKWDPLKGAAKPAVPAMPASAPKPLGPETQALADKQAARSAIAREAADKLKLASSAPVAAVTEPARKPRVAKPKTAAAQDVVTPKPRAPRKKPKADEA